jgi:hypothetical protein
VLYFDSFRIPYPQPYSHIRLTEVCLHTLRPLAFGSLDFAGFEAAVFVLDLVKKMQLYRD